MTQITVTQALEMAIQHMQLQNFEQASSLVNSVLEADPSNPDALHISALVNAQQGNVAAGIKQLEAAVQTCPEEIPMLHNLANLYRSNAQFEKAADTYQKILRTEPEHVHALVGLGHAYLALDQLDEAIHKFGRAAALAPNEPAALINLGVVQTQAGRYDDAELSLSQALSLDPNSPIAANNLGVAMMRNFKPTEAAQLFQRAIQLEPTYAEAYRNLANLLSEWERRDEALPYYDMALKLDPNFVEAMIDRGTTASIMGQSSDAMASFARALELQPNSFMAQWGQCMSTIKSAYDSESDIARDRATYKEQLININELAANLKGHELAEAAEAVGTLRPFYLSYHGQNNRELQSLYGQLVSTVMQRRYPQFSKPISMPKLKPGEKVRIGFVSRYFVANPVWRMVIKGWMRNFNRDQFELFAYFHGMADEETEKAKGMFDHFTEGLGFERMCERIKSDRLHVMILSDVLLEPLSVKLGSLRLAPIQCLTWGHPDTSGLKQIDHYLTSDDAEPANAEQHYSEPLVRLPGLLPDLSPPDKEPAPGKLHAYGIRPDATLYLCVQSLYKYAPQHDYIYPEIAKRVPDAQFVFIRRPAALAEQRENRLKAVFTEHGVDFEKHVVFLPDLTYPEYLQLCLYGHAFLDTLNFSGGGTTLDALACGLPVVTIPGEFMRGRQSAVYLKCLRVEDTVSNDLNAYINTAVRLGTDHDWRESLRKRILENRHRLYGDQSQIRGLEKFLRSAIAEKLSV